MTSEKPSKSWKWTKEAVLADALKYSSKSEWRKNSRAYAMATRQGWLDEACAHMQVLWTAKWNKEAVLADALKYQARGEWENNSSGQMHKEGRRSSMGWSPRRQNWEIGTDMYYSINTSRLSGVRVRRLQVRPDTERVIIFNRGIPLGVVL